MSGRLDGKVALVTGAGSIGPGWGNGKASSVLFAREGARVLGVDLRLEAAEETAGIVAAEGGELAPHRADVASEADVRAMVEACLARFGRIDVLVNNVGVLAIGGPEATDEATWDRVTAINLKSMYLTCRHVLPAMVRQGRGSIVNISSIAALRWTGVPYATYYASKAGMLGLSRGIALEYARRGIRCNCVLPGLMNTPMVHAGLTAAYGKEGDVEELVRMRDAQCPMGHMGEAFDVAHACLYLASDDAQYVTAAELVVDGGLTAKFA
jgi:NAD(P)-dependent dehydrogenase (short-subunit alcohol dehydrogenase family)